MIVKTIQTNLKNKREDKRLYQYLTHKTILSLFLISAVFLALIPTTTPFAHSQANGTNYNNLPNIFVTSPEAVATHQLPLKTMKHASESEVTKVSTFNIDFTNVVQIPQNGSIIIVLSAAGQDPSFQITNTRLKDASNDIINLPKTTQNTFSLKGIPTGVYSLDVMVIGGQQGNTQGVYETILVILPPNRSITDEIKRVIQQRIEYEIVNVGSILIDPPAKNDPCNYYGLNICDENGDCDSERFDCWSDCRDGSKAVTGQCPGDDDEVCWDNGLHLGQCRSADDSDVNDRENGDGFSLEDCSDEPGSSGGDLSECEEAQRETEQERESDDCEINPSLCEDTTPGEGDEGDGSSDENDGDSENNDNEDSGSEDNGDDNNDDGSGGDGDGDSEGGGSLFG